jgi:hypothetical protein
MCKDGAFQTLRGFHSSCTDAHSASNLPFLPSDSAQSFNPDASYGEIPASTPDFNFARPLLAPPPPDTLQRVGPPRKKNFVLWTEMVNDEFVVRWLKTGLPRDYPRILCDI